MSLRGEVSMLGYDGGPYDDSWVLYVGLALHHPQLQLGRAGPPPRASQLWTGTKTSCDSLLLFLVQLSEMDQIKCIHDYMTCRQQ